MCAERGDIRHAYPRHLSAHLFVNTHPKLSSVGLSCSIGQPISTAVFILADNLAVITTIAVREIDQESLGHLRPPFRLTGFH